MKKNKINEDRLNELLLPFIDKGFLDFFPNAKTDLLHTFIQSLGEVYHMDKINPVDRPDASVFLDFLKVLDLLVQKTYAKYIPDFFLAISLSPVSNKKKQSHIVSPARRLSSSLLILQLDQIMEEIMNSESWVPSKQVGKSLFVIRNNLVVSFGLPSLAKQADVKQLATDMKLTIKPYTIKSETNKISSEEALQAYLEQHESLLLGEAELHLLASDQLRIKRRMELFR